MARKTTSSGGEADIVAAGGVVLHRRPFGRTRVAVIHRPRYQDWSLPKGKLEDGEDFLEAALREVEEETALRCEAGEELSPTHYEDRKGRSKMVRYWLMRPSDGLGAFEPHDEVDEVRWLRPAQARELLTYDHDRELVDEALARRPRLFRRR